MEEAILKNLSKIAKTRGILLTFEKDQVLFYQDHQPFGAFLVEEGKVALMRDSAHGKKAPQAVQSAGSFLGVDNLLKNQPYPATATCLEKSRIYFLPRPQIEKWLGK